MARSQELRVVVSGDARQLNRAMAQASASTKRFGKAAEQIHVRMQRSFMGVTSNALKAGSAAVGAYASIASAKNAVSVTEDLAKSTLALHRNLGLSVKTASQWAAVARARGVDTDALNSAFSILARNAQAAAHGGDAQAKAFRSLGISQRDLHRGNKDFNNLLGQVAEGFGRMEGGTKRSALAMAVLGRSSQTTLPIFTQGNKAMREQLALAEKYGVTFGGKPVKSIKELVAAQREMEFAQMGLQVAFATQVAPTLTKIIGGFAAFAKQLRDGTGAGGKFVEIVKQIAGVFGTVGRAIGTAVRTASGFIQNFIRRNQDGLRDLGQAFSNIGKIIKFVFIDVVVPIMQRALPGIRQVLQGMVRIAKGVIEFFTGVFTLRFGKVWDGLKDIFRGGLKALGGVIRTATAPLREGAARLGGAIAGAIKGAFGGVVEFFRDRINNLIDIINAAIGAYNAIPLAPNIGKIGHVGSDGTSATSGGTSTVVPGGAGLNPGSLGKLPKAKKAGSRMVSAATTPLASAASTATQAVARMASSGPMAHTSSRRSDAQIIAAAARRYGIDPRILWGVYGTESGFGRNLGPSSAGALGPFQFMPGTARAYGVNVNSLTSSATGAAHYLHDLIKQRGSVGAALNAYSGGGGAGYAAKVQQYSRSFPGGGHRAPARPQIKRGTSLMAAGIISKKFGLRISSGYRTPEHNAAVGGVDGSYHTRGSASNPGAVDLVGSSSAMSKASAWASSHVSPLAENMVHNAGSGLHLHLGFASSSVTVRLDPGDSGAGSGGFAAAAKPPTQAEINQSHFQAVSNRLETIGLKRDAGLIGAGTADRQTIGTIGQALHGRFGSLARRDKLSLMGTQRQTRQELTGRLKAKKATRSHGPFNGFLRVYNGIQDQIDAGNVDPEVGRRQQMAHAQFALDGQYGKLTSGDRLEVQKILRQLKDNAPDAPDALDPTSFAGTAFDDAALTQAQVDTPNDQTDDIGVMQGRLDIASAAYAAAKASGDRAGIATWGGLVGSLRSEIESARGSGSQADLAQAMKELTEQIKAQNNFAAQVASVSLGEAWRALSDVISGQISGVGYAGRASSAGSGSIARW